MINNEKIVDFSLCKECEYSKTPENKNPCYTCLIVSARSNSRIPEYFLKAKNEAQKGKRRKAKNRK